MGSSPIDLSSIATGTWKIDEVITNNLTFSALGNQTVKRVVTLGSCSDSTSQIVEVVNLPDASITGLAAEYCKTSSDIMLQIDNASNFEGTWYVNESNLLSNHVNFQDSTEGTKAIKYIYTIGGCEKEVVQLVEIIPEIGELDIGQGFETQSVGDEFLIDLPTFNPHYEIEWSFNTDELELLTPTENEVLIEVVKEPNNESIVTLELRSTVCSSVFAEISFFKKPLRISEGISPNDDGINDFFEVINVFNQVSFDLTVFNRWGQIVYQENNYSNSWNGINQKGKELPSDVYYYQIQFDNGVENNGALVIKR